MYPDGREEIDGIHYFTYTKKTTDLLRKFLLFIKELSTDEEIVYTDLIETIYSDVNVETPFLVIPVQHIRRIVSKKQEWFILDYIDRMKKTVRTSGFIYKKYKSKNGFVYEMIVDLKRMKK